MRVHKSAEADSSWEDHGARYRVYFFEGGDLPGHSWSVDTFDITGTEVDEVIRWAESEAGEARLFAVALVGERSDEGDPAQARQSGLTWLLGTDANDSAAGELEERLQQRMRDRRSRLATRPTTTGEHSD